MPASSIDRIADPLKDEFTLSELPRIAPWVYEQIMAVGPSAIMPLLPASGSGDDERYPMTAWVSAVSACHSDLWRSLAQG